jgi:hypothetical protein
MVAALGGYACDRPLAYHMPVDVCYIWWFTGQPKALGNQGATMPTSHIFGKPSVRRGCGDWDAKACLQGKPHFTSCDCVGRFSALGGPLQIEHEPEVERAARCILYCFSLGPSIHTA